MTGPHCLILGQLLAGLVRLQLATPLAPPEPLFLGEQFDLNAGDSKSSRREEWIASGPRVAPFDEVERFEPRVVTVSSNSPVRKLHRGSSARRPQAQRVDDDGDDDPESSEPGGGPATPLPTAGIDEVFCDFGPLPAQSLCEWQDGCGDVTWITGTGISTNWLGGPPIDATAGTPEGGYGYLETSQTPSKLVPSGTSVADTSLSPNGRLHGPQLGSTGVAGTCIMFKYALNGLSSAGLRLLLHPGYDEFSSTTTKRNHSLPGTKSCDRPSRLAAKQPVAAAAASTAGASANQASAAPITVVQPPEERILWHAHYHTLGTWQQAQILYTYPDIHTLIMEGLPVDVADPSRSYRGYIAIDDIDLQPGSLCIGFCNFAAGFCDWANDIDDDFDWSISRGSSNPTTGPVMDRESGALGGSLSPGGGSSGSGPGGGGYAYIDSSYPRRPGDVARLSSKGIPATAADSPMCLHFSFHMFGSGVGELRVALKHARSLEGQLAEIWRLRGNAGNSWFDSRVTISSLDDFQLVFEASVGNTGMGDIAIDDIAFTAGPCPTSPQVAAPSHFPHDCTFEIDECEWINSRGDMNGPSSVAAAQSSGLPVRGRVSWERVSQQSLSPRNQRKPYSLPTARPRQEFFVALQTRGVTPALVGTAYLLSPEIKPSGEPLCLSFWYLMFESFIDATGPSLGVLRVLLQPVGESLENAQPIWQLYNNQGPTWYYGQTSISEKRSFNILFEGTWGPNRASGNIAIDDISFYTGNCTISPSGASVRPEDCSFEKDLCGWENVTSSGVNDPRVQWQRAYPNHRPAQLLDKTFGSSGDFIFFDIFSPKQRREVRLRSPVVKPSQDEEASCFTFWFAAFGVEEGTGLRIIKMSAGQDDEASPELSDDDEDSDKVQVIWALTAKGFNNPRPSWTWAQVTIDNRSPYRLVLEGSASNGGFAIDDIKFQPQACSIRPPTAKPASSASQELL